MTTEDLRRMQALMLETWHACGFSPAVVADIIRKADIQADDVIAAYAKEFRERALREKLAHAETEAAAAAAHVTAEMVAMFNAEAEKLKALIKEGT